MPHTSTPACIYQKRRRTLLFRYVQDVLIGMSTLIILALVFILIIAFFDASGWGYAKILRSFGAFLAVYTIGFSVFAVAVFYHHIRTDELRRLKWTQPSSVGDLDNVYRAIRAEHRKPRKR
jgi:hypothetical protein